MGEFGMGFRNREDAPCGWAAVSDGQPMPGMEMDLRPAPGDEELSRLWVRGAQLCVGYGRVGADEPIHPTWSHNGGWLDTGALVWDDGRGGIRLAHGASRLMGTSVTVPAAEIEEEILRHPGVREVAVVGHMDDQGRQLTSAVIVPSGDRCPALAELIGILTERGMTPWYLPTRLRKVKGALPRTPGGGIDYDRIRALMSAG
jgi:cyclohexanecarboxylate-CoA ligase